MSKTITGTWITPTGAAVANGKLYLQLSQDATVASTGQVAPSLITIQLDATGSIPAATTIWANDELSPGGTTYQLTVAENGGGRVYGPEQFSITGSSPINLNSFTPSSSGGTATANNPIIASVSLTGQSASIGTTTFFTTAAAGLYRITVSLITTTTGVGNVFTTFGYNNGTASNTIIGATLSFGSSGAEATNTFTFYSPASQTVTYATTYASTGGYALRVRLEYLG